MYTKHLKKIKKGGAGGAILIRILVITLLVVMPLIPTQTVSAQCEIPPCPTETPAPPPPPTSTPYYGPTIVNPFGSTPTPSVAGDCPTGFLEPNREVSMKWLNQCKKCVPEIRSSIPTFAPYPTFDINDFINATAVPALTPTPVLTPTVDPNSDFAYSVLGTNIPPDTSFTTTGQVFNINRGTRTDFPIKYGVIETYHLDRASIRSTQGGGISIYFLAHMYGGALGVDVTIVESNFPTLSAGTTFHINAGATATYTRSFPVTNSGVYHDFYDDVNYTIKYNVSINSVNSARNDLPSIRTTWGQGGMYSVWTGINMTRIWSRSPVTITPPYASGYCSTYAYADNGPGGEGYGEPLVGLPNINVWQGECIDFIPPFEWFRDSSGSFLFDADLSFPGIGLCPVWVEIEPLEILDITIPFEILIVPALMFVFSLIFKL